MSMLSASSPQPIGEMAPVEELLLALTPRWVMILCSARKPASAKVYVVSSLVTFISVFAVIRMHGVIPLPSVSLGFPAYVGGHPPSTSATETSCPLSAFVPRRVSASGSKCAQSAFSATLLVKKQARRTSKYSPCLNTPMPMGTMSPSPPSSHTQLSKSLLKRSTRTPNLNRSSIPGTTAFGLHGAPFHPLVLGSRLYPGQMEIVAVAPPPHTVAPMGRSAATEVTTPDSTDMSHPDWVPEASRAGFKSLSVVVAALEATVAAGLPARRSSYNRRSKLSSHRVARTPTD